MTIATTFTSCSIVVAVLLQCVVVICESPAYLKLERAVPHNDQIELSQLRDRDTLRHCRFLKQDEQQHFSKDVIDFAVKGTYDPYIVGLYYTKVQLGSPPKEYYVQVDTGSDVLWVSCKDCKGCPTSSGLKVPIVFFDPESSSTSSLVSSSDKMCSIGIESDEAVSTKKQCTYTFKYGDGSSTSGYYVSDLIHLDMMSDNTNVSSQVMFGCSTAQSGELSRPERAVDGIFGFGQQGLSVIKQLASQGAAPDAFSHCLVGDGDGGGILVLGQILDPHMVYSPLVSSETHYSLELHSISVNNQTLKIDSSVFRSSHNRKGTIIDSGTTLGYLAEQAYDPFVEAITKSVSQSVHAVESKGYHCYITKNSVSEMFPSVSLNFAGDASMVLKPENYLLKQKTVDGGSAWCIAFQKVKGLGVTILGDIVLKDKSVVYDLGGQRIGWVDHDCKKPVNVSTKSSGRRRISNANNPLQNARYLLTPIMILTSMLHISIFSSFFLITL
ncbi:aspartic proteinase 36-like [Rutidosis leptorrhynchoides]|uniref:aspartic proteinase 36-like n=1 Tax=Rutidosis leptorrhynchoides TaxID=125765 RepID=UPI003A99850D